VITIEIEKEFKKYLEQKYPAREETENQKEILKKLNLITDELNKVSTDLYKVIRPDGQDVGMQVVIDDDKVAFAVNNKLDIMGNGKMVKKFGIVYRAKRWFKKFLALN